MRRLPYLRKTNASRGYGWRLFFHESRWSLGPGMLGT